MTADLRHCTDLTGGGNLGGFIGVHAERRGPLDNHEHHFPCQFQKGVLDLSLDDAIRMQRDLLVALAAIVNPLGDFNISGACADVSEVDR